VGGQCYFPGKFHRFARAQRPVFLLDQNSLGNLLPIFILFAETIKQGLYFLRLRLAFGGLRNGKFKRRASLHHRLWQEQVRIVHFEIYPDAAAPATTAGSARRFRT